MVYRALANNICNRDQRLAFIEMNQHPLHILQSDDKYISSQYTSEYRQQMNTAIVLGEILSIRWGSKVSSPEFISSPKEGWNNQCLHTSLITVASLQITK